MSQLRMMTRNGSPDRSPRRVYRNWDNQGNYRAKTARIEKERSLIPICGVCGVRCAACRNLKWNGSPHHALWCCLTYPETGESGDSYNLELREKE